MTETEDGGVEERICDPVDIGPRMTRGGSANGERALHWSINSK